MNTYDVGDQVKCSVAFTDANGNAADPTTVLFKYLVDHGSTTTLTYGEDDEVVNDATGSYYVLLTVNAEGTWTYRFEGTGAVVAAAEDAFNTRDSAFY